MGKTPWMRPRAAAALLVTLALAGCSSPPGDDGASADPTSSASSSDGVGASDQEFPDVVEAVVEPSSGAFDVDATVSSPYDTPERYADAFRVRGEDGTVYGVRELTHDHASEQPFTRTLTGLDLPDDVDEVVVEGRDQANGWGGATVTVEVPRG